jgi:hypothetical protein
MGLNDYMASGMRGVDEDMYGKIGPEAMLLEAQKIDPNARWRMGDIGSGGEDPHAQQGHMLQIDPALYAAALRKP